MTNTQTTDGHRLGRPMTWLGLGRVESNFLATVVGWVGFKKTVMGWVQREMRTNWETLHFIRETMN